eukprot:2359016-Prymnesium_polylepis.1
MEDVRRNCPICCGLLGSAQSPPPASPYRGCSVVILSGTSFQTQAEGLYTLAGIWNFRPYFYCGTCASAAGTYVYYAIYYGRWVVGNSIGSTHHLLIRHSPMLSPVGLIGWLEQGHAQGRYFNDTSISVECVAPPAFPEPRSPPGPPSFPPFQGCSTVIVSGASAQLQVEGMYSFAGMLSSRPYYTVPMPPQGFT